MRAGMLALTVVLILLEWPGVQPPAELKAWTEPVTVKGYVCEPARPTSGGNLAFVVCTDGGDRQLPARIRATLDGEDSRHRISGGVVLEARLDPPRAPLNAGGGGFEQWLWRERIGAVARVRSMEPAPEFCDLACHYHSARIALIHRLNRHGERLRNPELVEALLFGSRAGLREEHWARLDATGTQHLVAISGLHVGLVAAIAGAGLGVPITRMNHRRPAAGRFAAFALVGLVTTGYALLAGLTVPTQRALVMVAVAGWMLASGRQWRLWDGWLMALMVVVMLEPRALWGPGFWLSFGAVACLILGLGARFRSPGAMRGLVLAQFAVVAGLAPLLLWHGMAPSGIAFAVNLAAIPWLSVVVMPVILVAAPLLLLHPASASWVVPGVDMAVTVLWSFLGWAQQWAFELPVPASGTALVGAGIVLCSMLPVGWPYRLLAVAVLGLVPLAEHSEPAASGYAHHELRVADGVGGPVVLIRDGSRTVLFDGREPGSRTRAMTRDRIGAWLDTLGVSVIDQLVLGDPGMDPQRHWASPRLPDVRRVIEAPECTLEQHTGRGRVTLSGLAAGGQCSLLLRSGERTALLAGPVDRRGERRILGGLSRAQEVDLLVAPRGGTGRSSQLGFIEALSPSVSVLAPPDWYQGEAGAPALERYGKAATRVLFTPRTGELGLLPEEGGWRVEPARDCGQKVRLC
ncbi:ComEC/Rec2 family competence protein [Halovibrio salipaludis]|nr:ComEC/Rec2 family competence protein [Halovibrio salipaludis]